MVLRKLCCCSSESHFPPSAGSGAGSEHEERLSARIVSLKANEASRSSSRSSVPSPRSHQRPTTSSPHLLDEKVPSLIQNSPLNTALRQRHGSESIHNSDTSSTISICGPRIVSLISTDTGASRFSTRSEQETRLSSSDAAQPPPPYSRTPPQQQERQCHAFGIGARHRRMHVHQNEFSHYIQQLRQRIEPGWLPPPVSMLSQNQQSETMDHQHSDSPIESACTQDFDFGQGPLEPETANSSRPPSPPNAPLLSRITTPSTFTTGSDRDEDLSPNDLLGEDPPIFPSRRSRTLSMGSQSGQQAPLEEAREGLFEDLDRQMRFEIWRRQDQGGC